MLGGSQAGARLSYRLNADPLRPLSLSARLYAPLNRPRGGEASLGVEWKPLANVPVRLLAERRQSIEPEGRSAFALTAHGGISDYKLRAVRLDAYAQAGVVGARSRDPFVDGSLTAGIPLNQALRLQLGAGLWGAAQPGAARADIGPQLIWRPRGTQLRITADWRMRIAGDARPGSGPALTVATDF
jgi:hypothetical protein